MLNVVLPATLLDVVHQSRSSPVLVNPKVGDVAALGPCIAADTSNYLSLTVFLCGRERLTIVVTSGLCVELVDAFSQEGFDLVAFTMLKVERPGIHDA